MASIELLKRSVGGIITSSTHQNVTKESVPHPPAKCQLVHHHRPFHIPVTLPTCYSYYPNVAKHYARYDTCQSVTHMSRRNQMSNANCSIGYISHIWYFKTHYIMDTRQLETSPNVNRAPSLLLDGAQDCQVPSLNCAPIDITARC